jgi:hypothetical protein
MMGRTEPAPTPNDAAPTTAENLTEAVETVIAALLGTDGATKPVKELIERIGDMAANLAQSLGELLGGGGTSEPTDNVIERIGDVMANLAHDLAQTLAGALGTPDPIDALLAQPLASYWHFERINGPAERVGDVAGNLARATDGTFGRGGSPHPAQKPLAPPVAPPVPVVPAGSALASYSPSLGASGSSTDAFQLLLFVLAPFSVALLQGGKPSWHRREPLRPHSALRLAVERPG